MKRIPGLKARTKISMIISDALHMVKMIHLQLSDDVEMSDGLK